MTSNFDEKNVSACDSSDFYNSNLFSEHLGTNSTLKLWPQPIYKVNKGFNGGYWNRNTMWKLPLGYRSELCLFDKTTWSLNYICNKQSI